MMDSFHYGSHTSLIWYRSEVKIFKIFTTFALSFIILYIFPKTLGGGAIVSKCISVQEKNSVVVEHLFQISLLILQFPLNLPSSLINSPCSQI